MTTPTVALLGTGIMGAAMGRQMIMAGLRVRAWNRTRSKAEAIEGATVCDTPAQAVTHASIILTVLTDGDTVLTVMRDALDPVEPDAVWAQAGTIGIEATEGCARLAASHQVDYVDAPVLGTKRPAEAGELLVLASGPERALARCAPVFDAIGRRTVVVGSGTEATRWKLVNNCWLLGMLGALAETIAFAERVGVDPSGFLDLIEGGATGTVYARIKGDLMLAGDYPTSFPADLARKDARLIVEAARAAGLDLPMTRAVEASFARAAAAGHGDDDMAALIEAYRS